MNNHPNASKKHSGFKVLHGFVWIQLNDQKHLNIKLRINTKNEWNGLKFCSSRSRHVFVRSRTGNDIIATGIPDVTWSRLSLFHWNQWMSRSGGRDVKLKTTWNHFRVTWPQKYCDAEESQETGRDYVTITFRHRNETVLIFLIFMTSTFSSLIILFKFWSIYTSR